MIELKILFLVIGFGKFLWVFMGFVKGVWKCNLFVDWFCFEFDFINFVFFRVLVKIWGLIEWDL